MRLPIKAFGMVIFSHIRSRTSSPDSGDAIALATVAISLWMDKWKSSKPVNIKSKNSEESNRHVGEMSHWEELEIHRRWAFINKFCSVWPQWVITFITASEVLHFSLSHLLCQLFMNVVVIIIVNDNGLRYWFSYLQLVDLSISLSVSRWST